MIYAVDHNYIFYLWLWELKILVHVIRHIFCLVIAKSPPFTTLGSWLTMAAYKHKDTKAYGYGNVPDESSAHELRTGSKPLLQREGFYNIENLIRIVKSQLR
jgi:hypothetical protein